MTKTHQLLDLMAHGRPVTYGDILAATGWTLEQAQKIVHCAVHTGYIKSIPHDYVITEAGIARQQFKPASNEEMNARRTAARHAKRKSNNHRIVELALKLERQETETMVQKSVRTNANSVFMLGEM